ncbi:MAG: cytochrome P450 [Bradymonadaceae bacterium]
MLELTTDESSTPPGPPPTELPQWLYKFATDTFGAFVQLVEQYGEVVRFPVSPSRAFYILSRPEHVKYVLQDNHRNYQKAVTYEYLRPILGDGLLTSEGDRWLRQRRLVAPLMGRDHIETFKRAIVESLQDLIERWDRAAETDDPIDVASETASLTLSVAGKILFSRDIGSYAEPIGRAMKLLFRDVNYRITSPAPIPKSIPTPHNRRVQQAIDELETIVYDLIDERRGREEEFDDLLSTLMLAEYEDSGERMSDEQVRDEVMTFLLAGHETTSNALNWTFYLLSKHPDVRRMLEDEVDHHLENDAPTFENLRDIDYLDMIFDEATRLYPPAWTIEREPIEDDAVGPYTLPAGSIVVVAPYFVHRNPNVWDNPEGFDPERFGPDGGAPDHRYAHFPFGGGPRKCAGADFATIEYKLALAMITRRFQLDLVPGSPVELEANVTMHPKDGLMMHVDHRD